MTEHRGLQLVGAEAVRTAMLGKQAAVTPSEVLYARADWDGPVRRPTWRGVLGHERQAMRLADCAVPRALFRALSGCRKVSCSLGLESGLGWDAHLLVGVAGGGVQLRPEPADGVPQRRGRAARGAAGGVARVGLVRQFCLIDLLMRPLRGAGSDRGLGLSDLA